MPARGRVALIDVFVRGPGGGHPVPLVADAQGIRVKIKGATVPDPKLIKN